MVDMPENQIKPNQSNLFNVKSSLYIENTCDL